MSSNPAGKSAVPGVPFAKGYDPRRAKGGPGIGGRPKDQVREACRAAFADRLPKLCGLADHADPAIALKALDQLARYGGLVYYASDNRLEVAPAELRVYEMPDNGRYYDPDSGRESGHSGPLGESVTPPAALPPPRDLEAEALARARELDAANDRLLAAHEQEHSTDTFTIVPAGVIGLGVGRSRRR